MHADGPSKIPADANYVVVTQGSISYTDDWYGPPDPQPTGRTTSYHPILHFYKTEDELLAWITQNLERKYGSPEVFKAFKITPIEVKTTVNISVTGT